jgi:hypothetical protein
MNSEGKKQIRRCEYMKIKANQYVIVAVLMTIFSAALYCNMSSPVMQPASKDAASLNSATITPSTTYYNTVNYNSWVDIYTSSTQPYNAALSWSFSDSNSVGITVYVLDSSEWASYSGSGTPTSYYSTVSSGSYSSDSGTFYVPYSGYSWYFLFYNRDSYYATSTYLTYSLSISSGSIVITTPSSSSTWAAGSSYDIDWTATTTSGYFTIELFSNSGSSYYSTITSDYYNGNGADYYYWTIPMGTPSGSYEIYIVDYSSSSIYAYSSTFTISSLMPGYGMPGYPLEITVLAFLMGALGATVLALKKRKIT